MPIRPELAPLYPQHWRELSRIVRFERAGGCCEGCGRPHLAQVRCLPDGRWFDAAADHWRDGRGRPCRAPDLVEAIRMRKTRVVLAAAHLDHDPRNNRLRNLRALCQRCHILHDRLHHLSQRWLTGRRRLALADMLVGPYADRTRWAWLPEALSVVRQQRKPPALTAGAPQRARGVASSRGLWR